MNKWLQLIAANVWQKLFSQKIELLKWSLEVPFLPSLCSFRPVQLTENHFVSFITDDFIIFSQIFVVSLAEPRLPLQIEDASRPETDDVRISSTTWDSLNIVFKYLSLAYMLKFKFVRGLNFISPCFKLKLKLWRGLYSEGLIYGRKFVFQNRLG